MSSRKRARPYQSPLRDEQHAATRRRIVDAMLEELRTGPAELSLPKVAKAANVSVPTVYRHFPTRSAVNEAIFERVHELVPPPEVSLDDLQAAVGPFFAWRAEFAEKLGAIASSPLVWEFRREISVPRRRKVMAERVEALAPKLQEPERTWLIDMLVVLFSDVMATSMRGYLGLERAGAAERVSWVIGVLLAHARAASDAAANGRQSRKSTPSPRRPKARKR